MGDIWTIAGGVVADAVRRRLVYVVIFFAVVLSLVIPYLPSFGVGVAEAVYREIALAVMFVAALVVVLSLSASMVPTDVDRRTAYAVLTRPVSRIEYLAGLWVGQMVTMAWVVGAFTLVAVVAGFLSYGSWYWQLWGGAFAIWLEMGVIGAVALAVSTRSAPVTATLAALTFLFVGHSRGALLAPSDGLLWSVYPSLDAFDVVNVVAHGTGLPIGQVGGMLLAFAGWSVALVALGTLMFRGRDL